MFRVVLLLVVVAAIVVPNWHGGLPMPDALAALLTE